jgi:hypothetical protein
MSLSNEILGLIEDYGMQASHGEYTDLGAANGWLKTTPEPFTKCRKQNHPIVSKEIGRSHTEYSCPKCKIKWKVDSGD